MLKFINDTDSSSGDLPWVNEYVNQGGTVGDCFPVTRVMLGQKGFMVFTEHFKGFVFLNSKMAVFLKEALDVWTSQADTIHPLFAVVESGGKINLAVDDELSDSFWHKEANKSLWVQTLKKTQDSGSKAVTSNPFLAKSPPTSSSGRKGKSTGTTPTP